MCCEPGLLLLAVLRLFTAAASHCGVQALGAWTWLHHGMWNHPGPGIKPISPALAGGFLSTVPPGKYPQVSSLTKLHPRGESQTSRRLPTPLRIMVLLEKEMANHSSILAWRIPTDSGTWLATVHGVAKSQTRLSDFTFTLTFQASCKVDSNTFSSSGYF